MRASALAVLAALSVAVAAAGAPGSPDQTPTITFKVVSMDGKRRVLSQHAIGPYTYSLSPDHRELAYIPQRRPGERNAPVMVADVRSPRERVLVDNGWPFYDVSWAPDGRQIALSQPTSLNSALWLTNPDGSARRKVKDGSTPLLWSPDSKLLASYRGISIFSPETGEERSLSRGYSPAWSPDTNRIAFVHNTPGYYGIAVVSLQTGAIRELTRGYNPAWSPDGSRIAFIRYVRDASHPTLWVISSRGGKPRRLVRGFIRRPEEIVWSPKGKQIAYTKIAGLFVTSADGRRTRLLARETGKITPLAWSRDGQRLLYFTRDSPPRP